jgi:hypothetical protein
MFGKKKTAVELGRKHILEANLEDLVAAKRLIAQVGVRCRDLLTANAVDPDVFAQKAMAERVVAQIIVLENGTRETMAA